MSRLLFALTATMLASAMLASAAQADRTELASEGASVLTQREVVSIAREHNPELKAALLQLESARWDVFGSEARFEPVLVLDGTGSQVATPNVFSSAVRINRVRRGDLGVELRKRLSWGTELSLRLSSSVYKSRFSSSLGPLVPVTDMMMGTIPALGGFAGIGTFGPVYGALAKFSLKQPLWRGRGRDVGEAALRESRLQRTASERARDRIGSELLRDVLTAYWELWYAEAALAIQVQAQAVVIEQRDQAAARVASGSLAPAEVLTFETQVATREEDVLSARVERERRAHELARLLGTNEQARDFELLAEPPFEQRELAREALSQAALAASAELRERAAEVELARLREKTADDPSKPRLDLEGYVQTQGLGNESVGEAAEMFVGGEVVSALLSLTYEAPIRDHVRRAEAAKARLAVQVAEEQLRTARQRVLSEVRAAVDRAAAGQERLVLTERTATIAGRQLAAEQARYASGASTPLAVLEAEDAVRGARLRLSRARADLAESMLVLEHLTGALLERKSAL